MQLICNVVLVSDVQRNESAVQIHLSSLFFFFKILFPHRPLQNIKQSSLSCPAGYQLSILYVVVCICQSQAFQVSLVVKNPPIKAGDVIDAGSASGLERSPGGGLGNPPEYSCLENPMERGAWWATVHGVAKSQT